MSFQLIVLHVGEYVKGGVYTHICNVLERQKNIAEISDVYLCVSKHKSEKEYPIKNENVLFYKYKRSPLFILISIITIFLIIRRMQPDVIHVHSTFAGLMVRIPYLLIKRKAKIIYCAHGWSFLMNTSSLQRGLYIYIERILSCVTDLIINISSYENEQSIKVGISEKKSVLIYNGIDEKVQLSTFDTKLNINNDNINILFVGRFDKQKGLDILLKVINEIKRKDIMFYLIGDYVLTEHKQVEFPKNVIRLGWKTRVQIDQYYSLIDAVVMPSRWEGFGLVAIEAMKNKKPVIASNQGALPELIKNEHNGYIFNLDNPITLKELLEKIEKNHLSEMGKNGYEVFLNKFTADKMNKQIIRAYMEC